MRFRTQFDEDYKAEIFAEPECEDEGLVRQDMRDECDVNVIMKRYQSTGELTHVSTIAGEYGDFADVLDYHSGLEQIRAADALFMELPSSVRDRFRNDAGAFLEFAMDPSNLDEMREMGLAPSVPASNPEGNRSKGGARTSGANATPEEHRSSSSKAPKEADPDA